MQSFPGPRLPRRLPRLRSWLGATLLVLLVVVIAASWMLVVYLVNGRNVLNEVKLDIQTGRTSQMQTLQGFLSRDASLSEHVELLTEFATPEFFEIANRQSRGIPYDPQKSFVFIINENTHTEELGIEPTPVVLKLPNDTVLPAESLQLLAYSDHHKVTIATFPRFDENGQPHLPEEEGTLELLAPEAVMTPQGLAYAEEMTVGMQWNLPIAYPPGVLDQTRLPFNTMLAVAMGLLATVMTPCLLQLLLYYLATLTGMGSEEITGTRLAPGLRRRLLQTSGAFVIGYTILFTGVGALAGLAGQTLQATWQTWTRPLAIASGVIIVFMALWMAVRSRAPLVCRIPMFNRADVQKRAQQGGIIQSTLMGLSFAVGCSTCFGGALVATLLLYVGTLGSVWQGAAILFIFSLAIGIPFMLAAALLTRAMPLMRGLQRAAPVIGLVSSLVVASFGVLLIFDKFHLVSAWMAPLLGLS